MNQQPQESSQREHQQQIEAWRQQRLARLRSDEGWLVVAGLFWLEPGKNSFGSAADNTVVLPAHSAPAHAGHFVMEGTKVTLVAAPGVALTVNGKPPEGATPTLRADEPGPADVIALGDLRFFVIDRDGRIGIRLRDLRNPRRAQFTGFEYFPVSLEYRVNARFVPRTASESGKGTIKVNNVLGTVSEMKSPGKLVFGLHGHEYALDAVLEEPTDTRFFVIFRDTTAGHETYGAGRFVYTDGLPKDGQVVLDFNKAYNPPCAVTPYATCPLPPPQNRINVRIEAGEKKLPGSH